MSICVHQQLVWYMTNKHAAGYVGLFKGPEMEALETRGSFSCPGVSLCQRRRQRSLAWVRSALSNMWWHTRVHCTSRCTHTPTWTHRMYVNTCKCTHLLLCCHHVEKAWYICLCMRHWWSISNYTCNTGNLRIYIYNGICNNYCRSGNSMIRALFV